jgi:hypothetical protein
MLRVGVMVAFALLLTHAVAAAQVIELEGRYWFTDIDGSVKTKSGGTEIDLVDDLGFDRENTPEGRLTFFTGPNSRIRLAYAHLKFDADQTLSRTLTFEGSTFTVNSRVSSELEVHYGRLGWLWQPLTIPGLLKFGGVLEAKGFVVDGSLRTRGNTPEVRESTSFPLVLPTVGLALDVTPHQVVHLFAEASGLPAGGLGHIVDAEAGLRVFPVAFLGLSAGYRVFDLRAEKHDDFAKLRIFGPFVGAVLRF